MRKQSGSTGRDVRSMDTMSAATLPSVGTVNSLRLGILSDTHDLRGLTRYAILALRQRGASFIVHCGDVGSPEIIAELSGQPAGFVWGNSDRQRSALKQHAAMVGVHCFGEFGEFEMDDKTFAIMHGDDEEGMQRLLQEQNYDYLLCGHTHVWRDERVGKTRIINPGSLAGPGRRTCALLDLGSERLQKITVA